MQEGKNKIGVRRLAAQRRGFQRDESLWQGRGGSATTGDRCKAPAGSTTCCRARPARTRNRVGRIRKSHPLSLVCRISDKLNPARGRGWIRLAVWDVPGQSDRERISLASGLLPCCPRPGRIRLPPPAHFTHWVLPRLSHCLLICACFAARTQFFRRKDTKIPRGLQVFS